MTNDFYNASQIIYSLPYWKSYRDTLQAGYVLHMPPYKMPASISAGRLRRYLAHHSVLYNLAARNKPSFLSGIPAIKKGRVWVKPANEGFDISQTSFGLEMNNPRNREGFRLTELLLDQMKSECEKAGIGFLVALIPSKESVFHGFFRPDNCEGQFDKLNEIVDHERTAISAISAYFKSHNIACINVLPAMQAAADEGKNLYGRSYETHPVGSGYKVMAEAIYASVKKGNLNGLQVSYGSENQ